MDNKIHYKMYKVGKHWMFNAITVSMISVGIAGGAFLVTGNNVHADSTVAVNPPTDVPSSLVNNDTEKNSSLQTQQQVTVSQANKDQPVQTTTTSGSEPKVSDDTKNSSNTAVASQTDQTTATDVNQKAPENTKNDNNQPLEKTQPVTVQSNVTTIIPSENETKQSPVVTNYQASAVSNVETSSDNQVAKNETTNPQETDATFVGKQASLPSDDLKTATTYNSSISNPEISADDQRNKNVNLAVTNQTNADALTGTWGTVNWTYDDTANKLSFNTTGILGTRDENGSPFNNQQITQNVKEIDVNAQIKLPEDSSNLFSELPNLVNINGLDKFDANDVTTMESMFFNDSNLKDLDVSNWNTSSVTNMSRIFQSCGSLSSLNVGGNFGQNTGKVTNMSYMFCGLFTSGSPFDGPDVPHIGLTKITGLNQLDTHNATDMSFMFNGDQLLADLDVSNFNTENVTNMSSMFRYVYVTSLNLSKFDTTKVTNMNQMFYSDNLLNSLDLSSFNTRNVTDMNQMLTGTVVLTYDNNQNIVSFGLWQLILGKNTILNNTVGLSNVITGTIIPPTTNLPASGQWQELGTGNLPNNSSANYSPNGQRVSASALMDGNTHPGTWVWAVDTIAISGKTTDTWNANSDKAKSWNPEDEVSSLTNTDGSQITNKAQIQQAINDGTLTVQYQTTDGKQVTEDTLKTTRGKYNVIYNWYGNPNYAYNGNLWYFKSFTCEVNVTEIETVKVNYNTLDNKTVGSATLSGNYGDEVSTLGNIPAGYHYEKGAESYTFTDGKDQSVDVTVAANTAKVQDTATADETVTYAVADGATAPANETYTAHFTRDGIKDLVTGEIKWSDWKSDDASYDIKTPVVANQTPDKVEVQGTLTPNENHSDQVAYSANKTTTTEYTTGRVTINYVDNQGNQVAPANVQSSGFTRSVVRDAVTGNIIETSDWTNVNDVDYSVITPILANRTADQAKVSGTIVPDENNIITVTYADNVASVTDQTTGSITINYVDENHKPVAPAKNIEVPFTRVGTKDLITGQITWNPWKATSDVNYQVVSPKITGMATDQTTVSGQVQVNQHDFKQVVYTVVPVTPSNPDVPLTPEQPAQSVTPSTPVVPENSEQPVTQTKVNETPAPAKPAEAPKQNALPPTGQDATVSLMEIIGVISLSIFGFFGIDGLRKRKEDK